MYCLVLLPKILLFGFLVKSALSFSYPCIPVMGFGFISDPKNFTGRLISSVDFCVEKFVVVYPANYVHDRSMNLPFPIHVEQWIQTRGVIQNVVYVPIQSYLIGVAEGWNFILKAAAAPWYLITAYDVEFFAGQLEALSRRFWTDSGQYVKDLGSSAVVRYNFIHTKWQNLPGGKGFNLFGVARDVIDNCGYFDENIFPAFWEDRDYQYRMSLWPGAKIGTYQGIRPWHGERFTEPVLDSASMIPATFKKMFNYTSGTAYLGPKWKAAMREASERNIRYVVSKWGCDFQLAKSWHHLLECAYKIGRAHV